MEILAKFFVRRPIVHQRYIYRCFIIKENTSVIVSLKYKHDKSVNLCQIIKAKDLFFVCLIENAQTNCQCVGSKFIASKVQATPSYRNTSQGCHGQGKSSGK